MFTESGSLFLKCMINYKSLSLQTSLSFSLLYLLLYCIKNICLLSLYIGKLSVEGKTPVTLYEKESY